MTDEQAAPASNRSPFPVEPSLRSAASLVVTIPLPFKGLYPNDRMNRWDKAAQIKAYRHQCFVDARNALFLPRRPDSWPLAIPLRSPVRAQAVFNFHLVRARDGDNLASALKAVWDSFVTANLLRGDTLRDLWIDPVIATVDKSRPEGVTITLTEASRA